MEVGARAAWLHVRAIAYCARHLTDGLLSPAAARAVGATTLLSDRLVKARLWDRQGEGFRIHDYLDYQPSRAEVVELRKKRAEAGRRGGSK